MAANELIPWINSAGEGGVRNSMQEFPGAGTNGPFEFNFAGGTIDPSYVKAYRYDPVSALTYTQTLTFVGPNQVTTSDVIPVGQFVIVYRDTPKDQPLVNYSEGAVMDEANLDKSNQQAVFIAAEMLDRFDAINATSSDAINRSVQALNTANEAIADAEAAQTASTAAVGTANSASTKADNAVATANDASATAHGIDAKAQTALDNSNSAVSTANAASATANGIDAKATQAMSDASAAVSTANGANSNATTALQTANGIDAKATQALSAADSAQAAASSAVSTATAAQTTANGAVKKSGDTMSGNLNFDSSYSTIYKLSNGSPGGYINYNVTIGGLALINGAGNAINLGVSDGGNVTIRNALQTGGRISALVGPSSLAGELRLQNTGGGSFYMRGRGPGGFEFVNNAYSAVVAYITDVGAAQFNSTLIVGNATIGTDGNIVSSTMPSGNLFGALAAKANAGAQVHRSTDNNFGLVGNGGTTLPDPWVVSGLSGPGNGTLNALTVIGSWLRNQ